MFLQALFMYVLFKIIDRVGKQGEDLKQNWKSFLELGLMLFILALAKNIAIVAVGAVVLFFMLHKKFKSAIFAIASFVIFYASFALVKTILWGEKAAGQSSTQMANLLYKDAYDVNKGKETLSGFFDRFWFNTENYLHMRDISVSILRTKWGVGYPGGSFVQAVVDNNLRESIGRADIICRECLPFFVTMLYSISMPREIQEFLYPTV